MDVNCLKKLRNMCQNISVLYVEDEEGILIQTSRVLRKIFDDLDLASDGEEALRLYKNKYYDLIITDLNMPNIDGQALSSKIKEHNTNQNIIIISAHKDVDQILKLVQNGISGYVLKPIDVDMMFEQIFQSVEKINRDKMIKHHNKVIKKIEEQSLLHENKHILDPLTNLYNYSYLVDMLSYTTQKYAMLININGFRLINEGYSYVHGNDFLLQFANVLKTEAKKYDFTTFRISSDNFVLIKSDMNYNCKKLRDDAIKISTLLEKKDFKISDEKDLSVHVRVAMIKGHSNLLEELYKTMSYAKRNSLKYAMYQDICDESQSAKEIIRVKRILQSSLKNNLVIPFFQPIVDSDGNVKHEVLMRIQEDILKDEYLTPISFLQIAKDHNYYNQMSEVTIFKALEFATSTAGVFSLNFTYSDMKNSEFLNSLESYIVKNSLAHRLIFEIVESDIIDDIAVADSFLKRFKALGVRVAIDDFGSGYSNFAYIFNINPDFIKLDGSLVQNMLEDEKIHFFIETIIKFAHKFDIKVIAEFVSSKELYEKLLELNVDFMQGYYIGHPSKNIQESLR
ncbi:hypothetical protein M947_00840 [Sulfurimonas hongkongensis]|uniref:Diguanylate cyclase n=1 Tax=Sulfurimonas hongkongensis TaxID=1172190 RepID=T0JH20_9BACT|nr:EAL domain-containing protein [Sulfurimonas hongkongensis]EQB40375.1 hypothetical protein M947_00840 [Sulfurimonas hongkongensis]